MEKSTAISIGAVLVAAAALIIPQANRATQPLEPKTVEAGDVEVASILKASPVVGPVHCEKKWAKMDGIPTVTWCCSDIGCGDTERVAILEKRAGEDGVMVDYTPSEGADGSIKVPIVITPGEVAPMRVEPVVEEVKPVAEPKPIVGVEAIIK